MYTLVMGRNVVKPKSLFSRTIPNINNSPVKFSARYWFIGCREIGDKQSKQFGLNYIVYSTFPKIVNDFWRFCK